MSLRERITRFFRPDDFVAKKNVINQRPAFKDAFSGRLWNDTIHPHQPLSLYNEQTGFHNLSARDFQSKHNFSAWQMSYGIANYLLRSQPYPFMYAEIDIDDTTTEEETLNSEGEKEPIKSDVSGNKPKSNEFNNGNAPTNKKAMQGVNPPQGMGLFGENQEEEKPKHYKLRRDLMDKYHTQWLEMDSRGTNCFQAFKLALSKSFGIKSSTIFISEDGKDNWTYWVYGADRIKKVYGIDRVLTKIDIEWYPWLLYEDEKNKKFAKEGIQQLTLGDSCVLITPFPIAEDPLGKSLLQMVWDSLIYKQQNRFIHSMFLWNGGLINRIYRYPNTFEDAYRGNIEQSSKSPFTHPDIQLPYPANSNPEYVDKMFQFDSTAVNEPQWDIANDLNSQDNPFPKSFIEGQVETGALGGSAPEVDKIKEEEERLLWFAVLDPLIKKINIGLFEADPEEFKDVVIVPWNDDLLESNEKSEESASPKDEPKEEEREEEITESKKVTKNKMKITPIKKGNAIMSKRNSMTDTASLYIGNLFSEGELIQDDGSVEFLSGEEIRKFVEDPTSVKEGYIHLEHPSKAEEVLKSQSLGRYKVVGYDENTKKDITEFYIYEKNTPEEIFTSPMYYSRDIKGKDGKILQTEIDVRNAVFTGSPRSRGRTKATKIK